MFARVTTVQCHPTSISQSITWKHILWREICNFVYLRAVMWEGKIISHVMISKSCIFLCRTTNCDVVIVCLISLQLIDVSNTNCRIIRVLWGLVALLKSVIILLYLKALSAAFIITWSYLQQPSQPNFFCHHIVTKHFYNAVLCNCAFSPLCTYSLALTGLWEVKYFMKLGQDIAKRAVK